MIVSKGSKIGIHSISPNKAMEYVREAKRRGFAFPLVKGVDNAGLAMDVKRESPETITITRFTNDKWDSAQDVDKWDLAKMQLAAKETIQLILTRTNIDERKAADYFEVLNEADPPGVLGWSKFGYFLIEVIREANRAGVKVALPGFNRGTPEWDEMKALVATGLFGYIKEGGHILTVHEGTFNLPVGATAGDSIPGAPTVAGAGSQNLRYRYLYSLLKPRNEVVSMVVSEYYPGASILTPAVEITQRMAWYDSEIAKDFYVLAVTLFTIDPVGGWNNENYSYAYPDIINYMETVKNRQNALEVTMVTIRPNISLNLRDTYNTSGKILTTLYPNTRLPVLEEKNGWIRVTSTGWISGNPIYVIRG